MNFNHFLDRIDDINLSFDQKKRLFDVIKDIINENSNSEDIKVELKVIQNSLDRLFTDITSINKNITSIKQDIIKLKNTQLDNYHIQISSSEFSYKVNNKTIFEIYNNISQKSNWVITDFEFGHSSILLDTKPFIFTISTDNNDIIINPSFNKKVISSDTEIFKTGDTFTLVNSDGVDSTVYDYNGILDKLGVNNIFSSIFISIYDENNTIYKVGTNMIFRNVLKNG